MSWGFSRTPVRKYNINSQRQPWGSIREGNKEPSKQGGSACQATRLCMHLVPSNQLQRVQTSGMPHSCRVKNLSKHVLFWVKKLSKLSFVSLICFSIIFFFLQGECGLSKNRREKKTKNDHFLSQKSVQSCCATYLDRFLTQPWPDIWLDLFRIFGLLFLSRTCWNPDFYRFSAKISFLWPTRKLGTRFVNTTALTDFFVPLCFFGFGGFCCVRFLVFFLKEWMKQKIGHNTNKKHRTTRCKQKTLSLVCKKNRQHGH